VYLVHASPLSDCPLLDALAHAHQAHPTLLHPNSFSLSSSSEIDEGAIVGKDFYTTFCFNSSSEKLPNTHTILFKQSIERINKRGERN
jgi:hypothetical protein